MAEIKNLAKLTAKLQQLAVNKTNGKANVSVVVGFTANYAIYVHEDLEAHHEVGQAKFLEQPARQLQDDMRKIIVQAMKSNGKMAQALLRAGLLLQRAAQLLCPVLTGNLKNSAFTQVEKES